MKQSGSIISFARGVSVLLSLLACGDMKLDQISGNAKEPDPTREHQSSGNRISEVYSQARVFATKPECNEAELNSVVYTLDEKAFFYCGEGNKWLSMEVAFKEMLDSATCQSNQIISFSPSAENPQEKWSCVADRNATGSLSCKDGETLLRKGNSFVCGAKKKPLGEALSCQNNQVPKWSGGSWTCQTDKESNSLAELSCQLNQRARWNGTSWACYAPQAPTGIQLSGSLSISENTKGAVVGTLSSTDPNQLSITHSIVGGSHGHLFEIHNNQSLRLKSSLMIDFETDPDLYVTVEASNTNGFSFKKLFHITVTDIPTSLLFANSGDNSKQIILPGKVGGGFNSEENLNLNNSVTVWSKSCSVGDFNKDGKTDFVLGWANRKNIIALNNGSFNFSHQTLRATNRHSEVSLSGDFNQDGNLDLFFGNSGYNSTEQLNEVYLGNGDGTFQTPVDIPTEETADKPAYKTLGADKGDLDGDGDLDLFVVNYTEVNRIYLNNGSGAFTPSLVTVGSSQESAVKNNSMGVILADFSGDGKLDAFIANFGEANRLLLGDGDGTFTLANSLTQFSEGPGNQKKTVAAAAGDFDLDGDLDIIVANEYELTQIYINNGTSQLSWNGFGDRNNAAATIKLGDNDDTIKNLKSKDILATDLNSDGYLDIVIANSHTKSEGGEESEGAINRVLYNRGKNAEGTWLNFEIGVELTQSRETWAVCAGEF